MTRKTLVGSLLVTITLVSCTVPLQTPTVIPLDAPTTQAPPLPTSTTDLYSTQVTETQIAELIEPYQYGFSEDLTALQRTLGVEIVETLWFTQDAKWWSTDDKQIAQKLLELGMNPGLGIRQLHSEGITGKGSTIAIIDQPVILDHPEFQGKIIKYHDLGTGEFSDKGSMHGPAVTSLLVGNNVGTAPDAKVYYAAVPSWLYDAQYYADALDWIVAENKKLPNTEKIRVVSLSAIPSGVWANDMKNTEAWDAAYKRATEAGILVLDCTYEHGYTVPCAYNLHDPDNVTKCIPEWGDATYSSRKRINIPTSKRSTAIERIDEPVFSYQYTGKGGLSWSIPYLAGVLAMGWQVNPELTSSQLMEMIYASAYVTNDNQRIINPRAFIHMVRLTTQP